MKLRLEATEEELRTRGPALVKALSARLRDLDPALGERLMKAALPVDEGEDSHEGGKHEMPAMEAFIARAEQLYRDQLKAMLDEMGDAIDRHVDAALAPSAPSADNVLDLNAKRG